MYKWHLTCTQVHIKRFIKLGNIQKVNLYYHVSYMDYLKIFLKLRQAKIFIIICKEIFSKFAYR